MNSLKKITFYPMLDFKSNLEKNGITERELLESYEEWHAQAVLSGLNGEEGVKNGGGIGLQAFLVAILLMTGAVANPNPRPEFTLIPVPSTVASTVASTVPRRTVLASPIRTVVSSPEAAPSSTPSLMAEPNSSSTPSPSSTNLISYPSPKFIKPPTPSLSQTVKPSSAPNVANATYGFVTPTYSGQPLAQPLAQPTYSAQPSPSVEAMDETVSDITGGIIVALALAGKAIQTLWNFKKKNSNKEANSVEISEEDDLVETLRAEVAKKESEIKESAKTILKLTSVIRSKSCKSGGGSNSDNEMVNIIIKLTGGPPRSAEIVKNTLNSKEGGSKSKRRTRRLHKRKN